MKKNGFTLIEMIVSLGISALAIGLITGVIYYLYRSQSYSFQQSAAINSARKGIEVMTKEIREAQNGDDGSYALELAGDNEFIFYSDIDKDASVEKVRYFLENNTLKKGIIEPTAYPIRYLVSNEVISALSEYVRNTTPIFKYYNGNYPTDTINNPLPTPTRLLETKLMHVYLKINVDVNRAPSDFELESDVQIRNLKQNL